MTRPTTVSVIVPTRNSVRTIEACLRSLRAQTHPAIEIIVVDNHSDDGTADVARRLADVVVRRGPERSAQRNCGLALASGDVVGFIDSDMYLHRQVVAGVVDTLRRADGVIVPELSVGQGFLARCRAHEKQLYVGDPDVEAARFFPIAVVRSVGGYREDLRAGEDWDLADRIQQAGASIGRVDVPIWHDDGRVRLREMFAKKRYYGRSFAQYLQVRDPSGRRLSRPGLLSDPVLLLRRPVLTVGLLLLKFVETSGLAVGVWQARRPT